MFDMGRVIDIHLVLQNGSEVKMRWVSKRADFSAILLDYIQPFNSLNKENPIVSASVAATCAGPQMIWFSEAIAY